MNVTTNNNRSMLNKSTQHANWICVCAWVSTVLSYYHIPSRMFTHNKYNKINSMPIQCKLFEFLLVKSFIESKKERRRRRIKKHGEYGKYVNGPFGFVSNKSKAIKYTYLKMKWSEMKREKKKTKTKKKHRANARAL